MAEGGEKTMTDVHDRLQVIATAMAPARRDLEGTLAELFAPDAEEAMLHEEGWILGVRVSLVSSHVVVPRLRRCPRIPGCR
jgi:hypothetical protein